MKKIISGAIFAFTLTSAQGASFKNGSVLEKSVWNSSNDPRILLSANYISKLSILPSEGEVADENTPWSDNYWARSYGGIAYRWQTGQTPYGYKIISRSKAKRLTAQEVKKLSPAEKFDLLNANYRFPLTKKIKRYNSPTMDGWQGICHGWSQAAIHHPQAKPITLKNKHGLVIPFGSSDVHALYSYYYGIVKKDGVKILGERCGNSTDTPSCQDVNAGAFHLVLGNMLGIEKKSFVADVDSGTSVWNQPAYSFKTTFHGERAPSEGSAPGTVREVKAATVFGYIFEASSSWEPRRFPDKRSKGYTYWLELDKNDSIIGGSWISSSRPDFVWTETKGTFKGKFSRLKDLL